MVKIFLERRFPIFNISKGDLGAGVVANAFKKWNSLSLIVRILIGLVIGAALGFIAPKLPGSACWASCSSAR